MVETEGKIVLDLESLYQGIEDAVQRELVRRTNIVNLLTAVAQNEGTQHLFESAIVKDKMTIRRIPSKLGISETYSSIVGVPLSGHNNDEIFLHGDGIDYITYKSDKRLEVASFASPLIRRRGSENEFRYVGTPHDDQVLFEEGGILQKTEAEIMQNIQQSLHTFQALFI